MSFKSRYHIAKLALFQVHLLNHFDQNQDRAVQDLINQCSELDGFHSRPSLMNQAAFLQMAYVCFVWLWESAKQHGSKDSLVEQLFSHDVPLPTRSQWNGTRDLSPKEVLRLIRNALSHGRVETTDTDFIFEDQRPDGTDRSRLIVPWQFVGKLCERVIHTLTPIVYPT